MPVPATEINKELCAWAHEHLPIPEDEDLDYYDKKISGMLIQPHEKSHVEELVIKQKARDYYDMKMGDFPSTKEFIDERLRRVKELVGRTAGRAYLEPPVYFNFGYNVSVGKNFYANFNCTFLDWSVIKIGDNVAIGPNCTLTTVNHPVEYDKRHSGLYSYPIIIEDGVWIGAGCMILSGVTIGEGSVIAAGSVVTRSIPAHVVAAGSPARVKTQSKGRNAETNQVVLPPQVTTSAKEENTREEASQEETTKKEAPKEETTNEDPPKDDRSGSEADKNEPSAKRRKQ